MDYDLLSPSLCADKVLQEIIQLCNIDVKDEERLHSLLRQHIRDTYDHCAELVEQHVSDHARDTLEDKNLELFLQQYLDVVAATLRSLADERKIRKT